MMRLVTDIDERYVILRCECKHLYLLYNENIKERNNKYVIPKDDTELMCRYCGKVHTDSVVLLEEPEPDNSLIKCPTCGSPSIEKISLTDKAASIAVFGIFSRNIGKTFRCKTCDYRW